MPKMRCAQPTAAASRELMARPSASSEPDLVGVAIPARSLKLPNRATHVVLFIAGFLGRGFNSRRLHLIFCIIINDLIVRRALREFYVRRGVPGRRAEGIVHKFLRERARTIGAVKIRWVARDGITPGWDLQYQDQSGDLTGWK